MKCECDLGEDLREVVFFRQLRKDLTLLQCSPKQMASLALSASLPPLVSSWLTKDSKYERTVD